MSIYVYGLMRAADAPGGPRSGEGGTPRVRPVEHERLAALVSDLDGQELRVRREGLVAHTEVLRRALEDGPVLPLRFGVVMADDAMLIETLLEPRAEDLMARLDVLEGKVEMQVKASYLEEPLLRSILASEGPVAELAARVRAMPAAAGHFERIRLGELIAVAVQARREATTEELTRALAPASVAVSVGEPRHERAALNAAFLVERNRLGEFDARVEELSRQHAEELAFKLIGPLAPHSFAEHELEGAPAWA